MAAMPMATLTNLCEIKKTCSYEMGNEQPYKNPYKRDLLKSKTATSPRTESATQQHLRLARLLITAKVSQVSHRSCPMSSASSSARVGKTWSQGAVDAFDLLTFQYSKAELSHQ